jgi:hypothetical protein
MRRLTSVLLSLVPAMTLALAMVLAALSGPAR